MRDEAFGDRLRELQRRGLDGLIAHDLWWSGGEALLQMLERATDEELAALREPELPSSVTLTEDDAKLIVDAAIAAGRSGPGVLIATVERVMTDAAKRDRVELLAEFTRRADASFTGVWRDAVNLLRAVVDDAPARG